MRKRIRLPLIGAACLGVASFTLAESQHGLDLSKLPQAGTVTPEDGLAAWNSIPAT
jgi:hypothetical protein